MDGQKTTGEGLNEKRRIMVNDLSDPVVGGITPEVVPTETCGVVTAMGREDRVTGVVADTARGIHDPPTIRGTVALPVRPTLSGIPTVIGPTRGRKSEEVENRRTGAGTGGPRNHLQNTSTVRTRVPCTVWCRSDSRRT